MCAMENNSLAFSPYDTSEHNFSKSR